MQRLISHINFFKETPLFVWFVLLASFLFLIIQPPIFEHDSYSYSMMEISRFPGFVIFMKVFKFLFRDYFKLAIIVFHLLFGFTVICYVLQRLKHFFNFANWQLYLLLFALLFPYFPPLLIANTIISEGISYPLYLLLITFGIDLIFHFNYKSIIYIAVAYFLLTLTRGQFILIPLLFLGLLIIKHRKKIFSKQLLKIGLTLLFLPILVVQADKLYRKIVYDHFVKTPYTYVNAIALPLYVSKAADSSLFSDKDHQHLFDISFDRIDSLGLRSRLTDGTPKERYQGFYNAFPLICNQNIHDQGIAYFQSQGFSKSESYIATEKACKAIMPKLIMANQNEYLTMYYTNVIQGFGHESIAFLVVLIFLIVGFKAIQNYTDTRGFVVFATALMISNGLIVAVACHSIHRYIFYTNFLYIILLFLCIKQIKKRS